MGDLWDFVTKALVALVPVVNDGAVLSSVYAAPSMAVVICVCVCVCVVLRVYVIVCLSVMSVCLPA